MMVAFTFFDSMGCRYMTINDVAITINTNTRLHSLLLYELNGIDFMFGEMLYLATSLAHHVPSAISCKISSYILPNTNNNISGFEGPPP